MVGRVSRTGGLLSLLAFTVISLMPAPSMTRPDAASRATPQPPAVVVEVPRSDKSPFAIRQLGASVRSVSTGG